MKPFLAWPLLASGAAVGVLAAWLVIDGTPQPVPDTTGPWVERVQDAEAKSKRIAIERDRAIRILVDSAASWTAQRDSLVRVTTRARATADSIAGALTLTLDSVQAGQFEAYAAERDAEARAVEAERDTWRAETMALRTHVASDSALIASLYAEVGAWRDLDAERRGIEGALRSALAKQSRNNRILAVAGVGLAILALR